MAPAFGQADIRESVSGFAPDYFAGSHPPSALEMVRLLPGFRLLEGDATVRGYSGAVGNILIDGRPPASKQDRLEDILKRIPAASVERVELIRAGAAGVDMQGYALLANVVRRINRAPRGRMEFETMYFPHFGQNAPRLAGEFSLGSDQVLDLSAAVYRFVQETMGGNGPRNRYALDGTTLRLTDVSSPRYEDDWTVSGTWRQPLLGGKVRVNALVKDTRAFVKSLERQTFPSQSNSPGLDRDILAASEFGLQYERGLWDGAETELVAIRRSGGEHFSQTLVQPASTDTSFKQARSSETILRGALRQRSGDFSLEAGAESAINTLNNNIAYTSGGANIPLPGAHVRISEWRSEFFATATWQPLENFTLEPGLRYEMSSLKQRGESVLRKNLFFLKPHLLASWKPFAKDEARLLYERQAGQLDFNNFIPVIMLNSNQLSAGNENLEPYTLWHSELAWEHRFAEGSIVLTARRQDISNAVDRIPIYSVSGVYDGVGNIGNGRRDEYQADFILPLDDLGVAGVTVQGSALRRFSKVVDPTTRQKRPITMDVPIDAKLSLTHDLPDWQLRWGATYTHASERVSYKFNEIKRDKTSEFVDAFIEYKPAAAWLIRLSAKNILDRTVSHTREIYLGPRGSSGFNYFELRPAIIGAHFGINIQRTFGE